MYGANRHRARPPPSVRQLVTHLTATEMAPRPAIDPEQGRRIIEASMGAGGIGMSSSTAASTTHAIVPTTEDAAATTASGNDGALTTRQSAADGEGEAHIRPDICLEALQMLMSTRARAKQRHRTLVSATPTARGDSRLSNRSASLSQRAVLSHELQQMPAPSTTAALPALLPDAELPGAVEVRSVRPPRPPHTSPRRQATPAAVTEHASSSRGPRGASGGPSRPATVAARTGGGAAPLPPLHHHQQDMVAPSSRFFSSAVETASRLTSLQLDTRIPADLWVMDSTPFSTEAHLKGHGNNSSSTALLPENITGYSGDTGTTIFTRRQFPSAMPNSKAEVAQLARCLDRLLQQYVPNETVLHDSAAFFHLPDLVEPALTRAEVLLGTAPSKTQNGSVRRQTGTNDIADPDAVAVSTGEDPYVVAALALLEVCDIGLCESVRHVGTQNIVLASLIDNLRAVCVDVARNSIDYVTAAKRHVEAQRVHALELQAQVLALQEKNTATNEALEALRLELEAVARERDELLAEREVEEEEEARDAFREGLAEAERFRFGAMDQLQASILQSSIGPQAFSPDAAAKISFDVPEDEPSPAAASLTPRIQSFGALAVPVVGMQRSRRRSIARRASTAGEDPSQFDPQITYDALVPFLGALQKGITATDAACGPFFAKTLLNQPQLGVSVASSRWVQLAQTIGAYENSQDRKTTTHDTESGATAALAKHVADLRVAGPARPVSISASELVLVLKEVTTTMTELATRLSALSRSPELQRVGRPELMPPLLPEVPCVLCHRVQVVEAFHDTKEHVLSSGVVELVAKPLREEIDMLRQDVQEGLERETMLKKRLDESKAKLRAAESEKLKESTQVAVSGNLISQPSFGASGAPNRHGGATDSLPLQLNLVINCKCFDEPSAGGKAGSRPGSSRSARPTSKSPASVLAAGRRLSSPTNGRGTSVLNSTKRTTPDAAESQDVLDLDSPNASAILKATKGLVRRKPPSGLSPDQQAAAGTASSAIVRADRSPPMSPRSTVPTEDELRRLIDLDQTMYRFPLFATSRDSRVLLTLGTAGPQALTLTAIKTLPWVLKQVSTLYRSKLMHDLTADFEKVPRRSLPDFILEVAMRHKYGDPKLVNDAAAALFSGCQAYFMDERVDLFARFVVEFYPLTVLHSCLKLQRALDDVCLGPQYSLVCNDDEQEHRQLSVLVVRRVAEALGKRPETTALERAALLNLAGHALFHSEQATQDAAVKALGRATISSKTMSRWSATEREEAFRIVPRSRVLSRFCDDLHQAALAEKQTSPPFGSTEADESTYVFPALASGDEGETLPPVSV